MFGCLAYYRRTETKGDKFEIRGRPGVLLGYPPRTKGYKIYDPQHNKIIVSRDVKFVEDAFPFSRVNDLEEEEEIFTIPKEWEFELGTAPPVAGEPNPTEENQTNSSEDQEHTLVETETTEQQEPTWGEIDSVMTDTVPNHDQEEPTWHEAESQQRPKRNRSPHR